MKNNPLKQKLQQGQSVLGLFMNCPYPALMEICGLSGFDFAVIDLEHSPLHTLAAEDLCRAADCVGLSPLIRVRKNDNELIKLPHGCLFQSKNYNPLLGDLKREFEELEDELIALDEFKKLLFEFSQYCKLKGEVSIGVHQIRILCSPKSFSNPAPEGIHRDGCDFLGIFAVNRQNIQGGETHLYLEKKQKPIFHKVLNPGEFLLVNDRDYFHFATPIKPLSEGEGIFDVFVLTTPSLISIL